MWFRCKPFCVELKFNAPGTVWSVFAFESLEVAQATKTSSLDGITSVRLLIAQSFTY